jgi:hypothetical protein
MFIAEGTKRLEGEQFVDALGFLQAEHVGLQLAQEPLDDRHAQSDGIDVPGGDRQCHGKFRPQKKNAYCQSRRVQASAGRRQSRIASAKGRQKSPWHDSQIRRIPVVFILRSGDEISGGASEG